MDSIVSCKILSVLQDQASEPSSTASDEAGSPGSTGQAPEAVQQTAPEAAVHQAAGLQGPQPAVEPVQVSAQLSVDADHPSAEADQAQAAERRSVLDTAQVQPAMCGINAVYEMHIEELWLRADMLCMTVDVSLAHKCGHCP